MEITQKNNLTQIVTRVPSVDPNEYGVYVIKRMVVDRRSWFCTVLSRRVICNVLFALYICSPVIDRVRVEDVR